MARPLFTQVVTVFGLVTKAMAIVTLYWLTMMARVSVVVPLMTILAVPVLSVFTVFLV